MTPLLHIINASRVTCSVYEASTMCIGHPSVHVHATFYVQAMYMYIYKNVLVCAVNEQVFFRCRWEGRFKHVSQLGNIINLIY